MFNMEGRVVAPLFLSMITTEQLLAQQQTARLNFGQMLRKWRQANNWTPYTAASWAEEAGFDTISYGSLGLLEQGTAGELRQKGFFQLQELNSRLAERNYGEFRNIQLLELVTNAKPLGSEEKPVWDATDFWACYTGLLPVPEPYR